MRSAGVLALRLVLLANLLFAAWSVVQRRIADGFATAAPLLEGYTEAIAWDPTNPEFYARRASLRRESLRPEDLQGALEDLRAALRLNPHNWFYWGDLAGLLEISGQNGPAEEAYRKAVQLSPQSGYTHWNLANFLLRRGAREAWLKELEEAVAREVQYQDPAAALLFGLGASSQEIDRVWPADRSSVLRLLRFAVERRADSVSDQASPERLRTLWERLLASPEPLSAQETDFYFRSLAEDGRFQDLRARWGELMAHNGLPHEDFSSKRNYIWDGGFETPPCPYGLCWTIRESDAERVAWTSGSDEDRSRQIRIDFLSRENINFQNLRQTVIVDPDADYEFSFGFRCDRLESDRGVYFRIQDPATSLVVRTEEVQGTFPWTRGQVRFRVPPGSQFLVVELRRDRSRRLGSKVSGTLWVDDVRLRRIDAEE